MGNTSRQAALGGIDSRLSSEATTVMIGYVIFALLHIPLALLMHQMPVLATVHALATFVIGVALALSGRHVERVAYVCAYITGAEVLWRMMIADVFWEFGKYSAAAIICLSMLRLGRFKRPALPLLYFALLLPSVVLTTENEQWSIGQQHISFNLSGPFALMVAVWFFSQVKLSMEQLHKVFLVMVTPIVGILTLAVRATVTAEEIVFTDNSNRITSGGYGPNQVSSILGLGALMSFFCVLNPKARRPVKVFAFVTMVAFATQSALTFSRGGLYMACGSLLLASFYLFRDARLRSRLLALLTISFIAASFILLPRLEAFTGGALSNRFFDTGTTGRYKILKADLEVWENNPVFGVGPGRSKVYGGFIAHTEFSRLLGEHGIFGLAALVVLLIMGRKSFKRAHTARAKALAVALLIWSFLYMFVNAMRLVAPSFIFGLSFITLIPVKSNAVDLPQTRKSVESSNRGRAVNE